MVSRQVPERHNAAQPAVLDNPVWHALVGTHRELAIASGRAARYPADVSPFMALADEADATDWARLLELAGSDRIVLVNPPEEILVNLQVVQQFAVLQMLAPTELPARPDAVHGLDDLALEQLDESDAEDMLDLAQRTKPGPFELGTGRLGLYYGLRNGGKLVAMAGERMRPEGWSEISGVCTDAAYRGRGLARFLMERVMKEVRERGDQPFLHVMEDNTAAISLYHTMGFTVRRRLAIRGYQQI